MYSGRGSPLAMALLTVLAERMDSMNCSCFCFHDDFVAYVKCDEVNDLCIWFTRLLKSTCTSKDGSFILLSLALPTPELSKFKSTPIFRISVHAYAYTDRHGICRNKGLERLRHAHVCINESTYTYTYIRTYVCTVHTVFIRKRHTYILYVCM